MISLHMYLIVVCVNLIPCIISEDYLTFFDKVVNSDKMPVMEEHIVYEWRNIKLGITFKDVLISQHRIYFFSKYITVWYLKKIMHTVCHQ